MYQIVASARGDRIESTLAGFFSVDEVLAYAAEVEPLIQRGARTAQGYAILLDVSECMIQSQAVIAAFAQHVARLPDARRLAVVTGSSIVRMQIRRVLTRSPMQVFDDRALAAAWLDADDRQADAA